MSEDTSPLASLSLTHVYYDPTDPVSHLCAWLALIPQALCVVYATLVLSTREAEILLLFAGQLACEAANFILKRLIKEARPSRIPGKGYGMPSSHAQFVAFWSVSLCLFLLVRYTPRRRNAAEVSGGKDEKSPAGSVGGGAEPVQGWWAPRGTWPFVMRLLVSLVALGVAGAVAASRVYLSYHTPKQVLAGLAAGVVCALAWFGVTQHARSSGLLGHFLASPLARVFLLRDLIVEEDPCWAGWVRWQALRGEREREIADKMN